MFIKKSEVAILVSDQDNSFVKFLQLYFIEKNLLVRVFESRNSLYLYLLTHNPEAILVSRQIKSNNHKQIVSWINNKYKTVTVLFDEKVDEGSIDSSYLDILEKAGPVQDSNMSRLQYSGSSFIQRKSKSGKDISAEGLSDLDKYFAHITENIVASIDRKLEIEQHSTENKKLKAFVNSKVKLEEQQSESTARLTHMLPVKEGEFSGFVLLNCDDKNVVNNFGSQLGLTSDKISDSKHAMNSKIKKEFLGSIDGKSNAFALDCQLPDFTIIENRGMLEVDVSYFIDENPVEFDVYIYMENQNNDYHYLSPGSSFSLSQIEKLKYNNKKVRVNTSDKLKLVSHLNVSHMIKISNEL